MNFTIKRNIDPTLECLNCLKGWLSEDTPEHLKSYFKDKYSIPDDVLSELFDDTIEFSKKIYKEIDKDDDDIRTLFSPDKGLPDLSNGCIASFMMFYNNYTGLNFEEFMKLPSDERRLIAVKSVLALLDEEEFDEMESLSLKLDSDEKLFNNIKMRDIDNELKLKILNLYYNYEDTLERLLKIFGHIAKIMEDNINLIQPHIDRFADFLESLSETELEDLLKENLHISIKDSDKISIYPHIFQSNGSTIYGFDDNVKLCIGINVFHIIKLLEKYKIDESKILSFLKAISDKSKLEILKSLKSSVLYAGQIAEILNVTNATVSHHMSVLLALGLIDMNKENNKVYYSLNKEKLNEYMNGVNELLL